MQTEAKMIDEGRLGVAVDHKDPLLCIGLLAALSDSRQFCVRCEVEGLRRAGPSAANLGPTQIHVCDYAKAMTLLQPRSMGRPLPCVLVVTDKETEADIEHAMAKGAMGYLLVGCSVEEVSTAVLAVSRGQRYLSRRAAQVVAERIFYEALTSREIEVLTHVAAGWSNKVIAARLGITEGTVKSHMKTIMGKLGASTRTEATSVAMRRGLVPTASALVQHSALRPPRVFASVSAAQGIAVAG